MTTVTRDQMQVGHLYLSEKGNLVLVIRNFEDRKRKLLWITVSSDIPKRESFMVYRGSGDDPNKLYTHVGKLDGLEFLNLVKEMICK